MSDPLRHLGRAAVFTAMLLAAAPAARAQGEWAQWGGPTRNFVAPPTKGLAAAWPEKGPKQLWTRPLGDGYSAIVADERTLYTMYSEAGRESVVALDASNGKTLWEFRYEAPAAGMNYEFGPGPHATPLVAGDMIFSAGSTGRLHALDKRSGKPLWSKDLWREMGGAHMDRGYSCSPVAYRDLIIVTLGGRGQSLAAFRMRDGSVAWKKHDMAVSPASHLVIDVDGQDQLVAFMGDSVVGVAPLTGEILWSHPHTTDWGLNITTPVWGDGDLLFVSSAYSGGSRVLRLARDKATGKTTPTEVWFHRRLRVHHTTALRVGDAVYASSGDFGPSPMVAVDVKTGQVLWQDRSFAKSNLLYADGRVIVLDEDGQLGLATVSPAGLKVISKFQLLDGRAWTVPTLVGRRLYVRDRKNIMALDLG